MAGKVKRADEDGRGVDIWLIALIGLLILTIGGGLYVTGQMILSRLDALAVQTRSGVSRLETEVFELRKQLQTREHRVGRGAFEPKTGEPLVPRPKLAPARPIRGVP